MLEGALPPGDWFLTALRRSGLLEQTFEVEVAAGTDSGLPIFTRGYMTVTQLVTRDDPDALSAYFHELEDGLARYGDGEPRAVPDGGAPVAGLDLTTRTGHFMGHGHNRLILFEHEGGSYVRAAGTWDPMPAFLDPAYAVAGSEAQHAFRGAGGVARPSMLQQLARAVAA